MKVILPTKEITTLAKDRDGSYGITRARFLKLSSAARIWLGMYGLNIIVGQNPNGTDRYELNPKIKKYAEPK